MGYQAASVVVVLWLALASGVNMESGKSHNHGHRVCSTWGNYHFKTFDGSYFQFPGRCSYNFVSDCMDSYLEFSVHVHRSTEDNHPFIDKITITAKDVVIQLKTNIVVVNGDLAKTPYYKDGILITKSVVYFKVYMKTGLTLMWNKDDALMVELDAKYNNLTCGLCGDFDGIYEFPLGGGTLSTIQYGNKNNIHDPQEQCTDLADVNVNDASNCLNYRSMCEEYLGHAAFSGCQDLLNVEAYINACMLDMCSCGRSQDYFCLCSTISEYSRQCSHAGGRPGNWRTDYFCAKQCPDNMIYQESASPCKNTCSHLDSTNVCDEHYMDGCFCPEGTVLDDYTEKGCVTASECSCKHQDYLYVPGESIQNDCNECHCISGRWNCTRHACPGACSIEGGAHITTFDGKSYTFHGDCYYVLSQDIGNYSYVVLGEITPCGSLETCLKTIVLLTDNQTNVVTFKTDGTVLLNEQKVVLPLVTASIYITQPSYSYIILQAAFGLQMQIQLHPMMQLYITMEESVMGQLQGLCGNFNNKEIDDLQISGGLVEATASAFANRWKTQSTCPDVSDRLDDPCSTSIENKNYADYWCSILEKHESPFAKCHLAIDPTGYAKRCRYDSCNCKNSEKCMCAALSSYVRACAAKGIILWGWKNGICDQDITCPSNQIYLYNLTTCQPTCRSLAEGETTCASDFTPVDGCGCPDGKFLNEMDQCVPISECSCYNDGTYVEPLEYIDKLNEHCTCLNGQLICNPTSVTDCPYGKVYYYCNNQFETSDQRSCKTLDVDSFPTACVSGCVCPNGLLDDGAGGCVPEESCPCSYKQDIYSDGTQIKVDCNTCLCQSGRWNCTDAVCYGTCSIYGNGHYITFDEKFYDFDGSCEFIAAQDYCGPNHSVGNFSIIIESIPCGTTGVTCSKAIKVFLGDKVLKLADEQLVENEGQGLKHVSYLTHEVGIYLVIEASNGILLTWDRKTTIFIKISPVYKGNLCGLCGNFDDNSQNDFMASNMLLVKDVLEFGNSWKTSFSCPDVTEIINPCSMKPHHKAWSEKQCGLIKSEVFTICHSKVDPQPFYEACVSDVCSCDSGGDCECFCTAVAAYAQQCTKSGACVYWRTPNICPIFCDYYNNRNECAWHYHPCGNKNVKTCHSINNVYMNVTINYMEGCYPTCPEDKPIFDEDKRICVPPELCGCYVNNTRYNNGDEVPSSEGCRTCICTSEGKVACYYNKSACFCIINGTRYEEREVISREDRSGICIVTKCVNGTQHFEIEVCPTSTPTTTSVTISTTPTETIATTTTSITSTVPTTTACVSEKVCRWTQWFNVSNPEDGLDSGDFETYDQIRKQYKFCSVPEKIECRAVNDPEVCLEDLKQNVHCNVSYGLICKNSEQTLGDSLWQKCYNYMIRVTCCDYECVSSTPATTSTPSTQTNIIPHTTTTSTTQLTTTSSTTLTAPTTNFTTLTPMPPSTTMTTTTSETTPACVPECSWSPWFDVTYPESDLDGGDFETYENIRKAGFKICEKPEKIFCRSERFFDASLEDLGQIVTCDVSSGLVCYNKDQTDPPLCLNYQISVYCCYPVDYCMTQLTTTPQTMTLITTEFTTSLVSTATSVPPTTTVTQTASSTTETTSYSIIINTPEMTTQVTAHQEVNTTTEAKTSNTVFNTMSETATTPCVCMYNGISYPQGEIRSGAVEALCYKLICSAQCKIDTQIRDCTTTITTSATENTPTSTPIVTTQATNETTIPSTHVIVTESTVHTTPLKPPDCLLVPPRKYNETWKIDNCTTARCIGNTSVEFTYIKCERPPQITCVNGLSPQNVTNADDQCCWHWECPCVCNGWGDPHYRTFDGTYYSFQGTCTYTLVEEIIKNINISVYIDNYNCGARDLVSCPRDIMVKYKAQTIRIAATSLLPPKLQVLVNEQIIGIPYQKNEVTVSKSGMYYVVEIQSIQSSIKYDGVRFSIKLPYSLFGNNTQGQCGTCSNNRTDDCLTKSGKYVSDCEYMAGTWIVHNANDTKCVSVPTTPPTVSATRTTKTTCTPSKLCSFINDTIFQKCHKALPPEDYFQACVFDSCHVPNSNIECSSLQQYAQLCAEQGFCIPWREKILECQLNCTSNKVYNACGPVLKRTCQTTPEEYAQIKNDKHFTEGCYCPEGTMHFSQAVDICVHNCGCVGPDNIPRRFGEEFKMDCWDCVCREGGNGVVCEKHKCSEVKTVNCELEGFYLVTQINCSDPCCEETVCKCNTSACTTQLPYCGLGYEAAVSIPDGHCCPVYTCVPKIVCVHGDAEYMLGAKVSFDQCQDCVCTNSSGSSGAEIRCTNVVCNKRCPLGYELKESTSDCCGECEQTQCVVTDGDMFTLLKPGEVMNSAHDHCMVYNCTMTNNQLISSVSQIVCPYLSEENCVPGTIDFLPNGCCKTCAELNPSCKLKQNLEYISYRNCRSVHMVNVSRCEGLCNTFSIYSPASSKMSHNCTCCQEVQTSMESVMMQCTDGHSKEQKYINVKACKCVSTDCESPRSQMALTNP